MGTSLGSFFNLLYQLIIAHRLTPEDFAAFNSLLSIFTLVAAPLGTLQTAVAKYSAEFNAHNRVNEIKSLLSGIFRRASAMAFLVFFVFLAAAFAITEKLQIHSYYCGYILAALLAVSCIAPVSMGGLQGLELFGWFVSASLVSGALKLILTIIFIFLGFNIAGALGALFVSVFIGIIIGIWGLRDFFYFGKTAEPVKFKEVFLYLFPVAISLFCFTALVNFDMVLVRYFFQPRQSGFYSLAQMVGKVFLFLPGAISIVMFPRVSGLNAKNMDTASVLTRSLKYGVILCIAAALGYNIFPSLALKALTGKVFPESVILGRFFGISMTFFSLLYLLITYFLSLRDLRFIKYLVLFTLLQLFAIVIFHKSLLAVQSVLCINAIALFSIHIVLAFRKNPR